MKFNKYEQEIQNKFFKKESDKPLEFIKELKELEKSMTRRMVLFCQFYIILNNGTEAVKRAGYKSKSPAGIASENLCKPNIKRYIEIYINILQSERIADAQEVLEFWTKCLRGEIKEETIDGLGFSHKKQISPRDRLKASEAIGKHQNIYQGDNNVTTVIIVDDLKNAKRS